MSEPVEIRAATWHGFTQVMGERGGCGGCWCMLWRLSKRQMEAGMGAANRAAMKAIFDAGDAPGLMAFGNFRSIWRYNPAENYVIGIGHLSDRLIGGPPIRGNFPPDENGLTRAGRQEVQRLLTRAGFDPGGADGVIGPASRGAIQDYQRANGLAVDGVASAALLAHLRR